MENKNWVIEVYDPNRTRWERVNKLIGLTTFTTEIWGMRKVTVHLSGTTPSDQIRIRVEKLQAKYPGTKIITFQR